MKTKEEYLLGLEDKLISRLTEDYKSINKNLIFAFTILFVFLLFEYGIIVEAKVAGTTLKLSDQRHLLLLPIIIIIPYFLINHQILSIARVLKALISNSKNLLEFNKDARPFDINDLDFYSPGIAGIQLQVSKFASKRYIDRNIIDKSIVENKIPKKKSWLEIIYFSVILPFTILRLAQRAIGRVTWMGFGVIFLAIIYIIPLLTPIIIIAQKLDTGTIKITGSIILVIVFLGATILYTLGSNIFLYSFYFNESLEKVNDKVTKQSLVDIKDVFNSIIKLYLGENSNKIKTTE